MKWNLKSSLIPQTLEELTALLLESRDLESDKNFFAPKSPLELELADVGIDCQQMSTAITRILRAKELGEDVLIFGDYDADGVCSSAILWQALKSIGIIARPFIPHREKHGYGLSLRSLEAVLAEKKPDLLITVDNGVVAHAAFEKLKELGIDAILTDHHQPEVKEVDGQKVAVYPPATAIVHTTQLCGSTVAWFLARELSREAAEKSLDLTAIATIADQMQLVGANRSFVMYGLQALRETQRVGLRLLFAKAGIKQEEATVNTINYAIAPRINAMGRIKHGLDALRLLCTTSVERADALVNELNSTNVSRQELTSDMIALARERAHLWQDEHIIVVESDEFHEGVIGLIAGKLVEEFYKPAIVISVGEKLAKASARSIPGVNIIEIIRLVREDLLEAGGHTMAAGFALEPEKIELVRQKLHGHAKERVTVEMLTPSVEVECLLPPQLLSEETVTAIEQFAPFGQGNREPIFGIQNLKVIGSSAMGKENKHLRISLALPIDTQLGLSPTLAGIGWGMGNLSPSLLPGTPVNVAGVLEVNEWKGKRNVQVVLKDISDSQLS